MWCFPVLFCIFKGNSQIEKATIFNVTVVVITDVVAPKKNTGEQGNYEVSQLSAKNI